MSGNGAVSGTSEDSKEKLALREAEAKVLKAEAEAEKAVADARSATFPAATVKGGEGKVELGDQTGMVADLVAHKMVEAGAGSIVSRISTHLCPGETKILLVDSPDLIRSDWPYMAVAAQIKNERERLEEVAASLRAAGMETDEHLVITERVLGRRREGTDLGRVHLATFDFGIASAAVQVASSLVGGAADLVSLFKPEYEIAAREVGIGSTPLYAALANHLIAKEAEVCVDGFSLLRESPVLRAFEETVALRLDVQRLAAEVKAEQVVPAERKAEAAKEARSAFLKALAANPAPEHLRDLEEEAERYERGSRRSRSDGGRRGGRDGDRELRRVRYRRRKTVRGRPSRPRRGRGP